MEDINAVKRKVEIVMQAMEMVGDIVEVVDEGAEAIAENIAPDPPAPGQEPTFMQKHCKILIKCALAVVIILVIMGIIPLVIL